LGKNFSHSIQVAELSERLFLPYYEIIPLLMSASFGDDYSRGQQNYQEQVVRRLDMIEARMVKM
jgi:hypothetical protein